MLPSPLMLKAAAARAARQAVLSSVGIVLALVGLGFLTSALWIFLARLEDSLVASLVVALLYLVVAGILLAMAKRSGRRYAPEPSRADPLYDARLSEQGPAAPPRGQYPPMMEAFIFGLNAASKVRRYRRGY